VCNQKYDAVLNIAEGIKELEDVLNISHSTAAFEVKDNQKAVGPKVHRKFYSEISADEMELIYAKFKNDFLLFGYSLDF